MSFTKPTAAELNRKLGEDFRQLALRRGVSIQVPDPLLEILFRTFAGQLEALCANTEHVGLQVLDELSAALGVEGRRARPAQTVVRFRLDNGCQVVEGGTQLIGDSQSREVLTFATDTPIAVSTARIAFALTYEEGVLQLVPDVELPERLHAKPAFEAVRASLGQSPAIFLAVENLSADHLSQHGFFFELSTDGENIRNALLTETWCLAEPEGEFRVGGILRPRRSNAGVRVLRWLINDAPSQSEAAREDPRFAKLPDGFYSGTVFTLPVLPSSRQFMCCLPKGFDSAMSKIFGRDFDRIFSAPRAWLRISMPRDVHNLHTGINHVWLNCVSASNVECLDETIDFAKDGTSIPINPESGSPRYFVAPLSIFGEMGVDYFSELKPSSDSRAGRYRIRDGRIDLAPGRYADTKTDTYATVRLWLTNGQRGNQLDPGHMHTFLNKGIPPTLRVTNLVRAFGGTDGEGFQSAQARFAVALLSRERIVTRADLIASVRALDRRILAADVSSALHRTEFGLQRVQTVRVLLDRNDFLDPIQEGDVLADDLTTHISERLLYDIKPIVEVEWK